MRPSRILLVGAGGHASSCIDVIEEHNGFAVAGLVGTLPESGRRVLGYEVIGTDDDLQALAAEIRIALVVVGQISTPEPRIRLFQQLQRLGYELPTVVSPRAHVSRHAALGRGTVVMHGAVVNAGARVGENCIVNTRALVEHDVQVGDHCHISTAATINGGAQVGTGTFVGSGSIVRERIAIGERCFIGLGQRVIVDCEADSRVVRRPT